MVVTTLYIVNQNASGDIVFRTTTDGYTFTDALTIDGTSGTVELDGSSVTGIDAGNITSGTLVIARGGTGLTGYATGDLIYASSASVLAKRTVGSTNAVLTVSGGLPTWTLGLTNFHISASAAIAYSKLALTSSIVNADVSASAGVTRSKLASGTANHVIINDGSGILSSEASLATSRGGTGLTGYATGDLVYAISSTVLGKLTIGTTSAVLTVAGGVPSWTLGLTNSHISASAAIAYSKLALTSSIVNTDLSVSAAIAYSKLALTSSIVNTDISASAAIAYSKLALTSSIVNTDLSASAAIARTKIASGTANHVIINDGSGVLSSEAVLAVTRGGTGVAASTGTTNLVLSVAPTLTGPVLTGLATSVLTGTADPSASANLTGSSTLFLSELKIGDRITINGETRTVVTLLTNTTLVVDKAFSDTANASISRLPAIITYKTTSNVLVADIDSVGAGSFYAGIKNRQVAGSSQAATSLFEQKDTTPAIPSQSSEVQVYMKANKIIFQYNDGGTTRYKYLDLTGVGVTWTHTTTPP